MSTYRCRESFAAYKDGEIRSIRAGDLIDASDEVYKGREALFDKVEDHVEKWGRRDRVVRGNENRSEVIMERATSEPGEKRSMRPRPSRGETKPEPEEKPVVKPAGPRAAGKKDGEV